MSPSGTVFHLEDTKSLMAIRLNDTGDADKLFQVDVIDMDGNLRKNYTCSFECLSLICAMLYSEGDSEDKTVVAVSFEALVNALTFSRNAGHVDASAGLEDADYEEEALEEYMNRETNVTLN